MRIKEWKGVVEGGRGSNGIHLKTKKMLRI